MSIESAKILVLAMLLALVPINSVSAGSHESRSTVPGVPPDRQPQGSQPWILSTRIVELDEQHASMVSISGPNVARAIPPELELRLLKWEQRGEARCLAAPRVLIDDGQTALLQVGHRIILSGGCAPRDLDPGFRVSFMGMPAAAGAKKVTIKTAMATDGELASVSSAEVTVNLGNSFMVELPQIKTSGRSSDDWPAYLNKRHVVVCRPESSNPEGPGMSIDRPDR